MKRKIFILILIISFLVLLIPLSSYAKYENTNENTNKITLKPLPYNYDSLEPYMDKETVTIHHDKHQQTYVDNLNKALAKYPELYSKGLGGLLQDLDSLPSDIKQSVINNGDGVLNHEFFWEIMSPTKNLTPTGSLLTALNNTFGSINNLKEKFKETALNRFGSGWAWLVSDKDGKLSIISTANQDSPLSQGLIPIIGLDVWEHAYYLKYQNRRGEYIDNWWNIVNWPQAQINYDSIK